MITFKGNIKDIVRTFDNTFIFTIETLVNNLPDEELNTLKSYENDLKIDISKYREKRSLNANNYAWVLMDKIAEKTGTTKEKVYREIIRRVGVFEILPIKDEAVSSFIKRWKQKGVGWVCEILDKSRIEGYTKVIAYFGTSTYDTKEMTRFIEEIITEAKELGIQTETPDKIAEMMSLWSSLDV